MITVQTETPQVAVGQQVRATVSWQHDSTPADLRVELQWFTEGRGDRDAGTVDRVEYTAEQGPIPPIVEVQFAVPASGPASYEGRMIRIRWQVKATLGLKWKRDPTGTAPLVVVPAVVEDT